MCSGTGENQFHSVRTPDGCCGRQKVRFGVTADRGCVTVNWKRHGRLFEAARVHVRAQLLPNTPEPLSHDQSPPNPRLTPSLPGPVQWHIRIEMQLRCLTESVLGSLVSLSDTFVFFLASPLVMHFSKHAQERPSYVYILLTFQTSKAARKMQESVDALLFPGQISCPNSCNQICHRIPQKSLESALQVSYMFTPLLPTLPKVRDTHE